jgi:hypothetical protein
MFWLDKKSSLRLNGKGGKKKNYTYGEVVPTDRLDKDRVDYLVSEGKLGDSLKPKKVAKKKKDKAPKREGK